MRICVRGRLAHGLGTGRPHLPPPTCVRAMDLHTLVQALGNTLDPALQKEAETFLDKVSHEVLKSILTTVARST